MASDPPLAFYFCYLESKNPREIVHSFTQTNPGPTSVNIRNSLQVLGDSNLRALTKRLIDTLNDHLFRDQFRFAIKNHTENYPSETAFIVVGIVLRCKPRAAPGFGSLGPTDLIAEAWLSSIRGFEAADRALDILRSVGIVRTKVAVTRNAKRSLEQHRAILARSDECEAMLSAMQGQHSILSELRKFNLRDLFNKLIATATDPEFYRALFRAVINHIKAHPYQTIFIVVGLVLILNPVGLAGFGALGPVAGSLAAAWQATYGGFVVAGSVFSVLQMIGMVGAVIIPMTGVGVLGAALTLPWLKRWFDETDMAATVIRWFDGIAGMPAAMVQWFKGMPAAMMQWFKDIDMAATMKTWWAGLTEGVKTWWEKLFGGSDHEHED